MKLALMGEGAVALRCAHVLVGRGWVPLWLSSADGSLIELAQELGVPHHPTRSAWREALKVSQLDVLFSVANPWVLREDELDTLRLGAINYHDSLLPRYAGMHATSWALMHGECVHGISWHVVTAELDAGRLLAQVQVPVAQQDTAFTLNVKCLDAAVQAFDGVLDQVWHAALGGAQGLPGQEQKGARSYYPARRRPAAQCHLSPAFTADELWRMVRAHSFGSGFNPLGVPKLWLGGSRWLLVHQAETLPDGQSFMPEGRLVLSPSDELLLGTARGTLRLCAWSDVQGRVLPVATLTSWLRELPGGHLPRLPAECGAALSALHEQVCGHERHWRSVLADGVTPSPVPGVTSVGAGRWRASALPEFQCALDLVPQHDRAAWAIAAWAWWIAGLAEDAPTDLAVWHPEAVKSGMGLFATVRPWRLVPDRQLSWTSWAAQCGQQLAVLAQRGTWPLDLMSRAPEDLSDGGAATCWPAGLWCSDASPEVAGVANSDGPSTSIAAVLEVSPTTAQVFGWAPAVHGTAAWETMDQHLAHLVHQALAAPTRALATMSWMDQGLHQAAHAHACGPVVSRPALPLHALVLAQAERSPHAIALRHGQVAISYVALRDRALRLAQALRTQGLGPGDMVGICLRRGWEAPVALLGTLMVGAAYLPLDPELPAARLHQLWQSAGAPWLLMSDASNDCTAWAQSRRLRWEALMPDGMPACSPEAVAQALQALPDIAGHELVCCICTSGSTGEPKAVEVTHEAMVNHALSAAQAYQLGAGQRVLLSASVGFDIFGEQLYPAWISGAEVVVRSDELFQSLGHFHRFVSEHRLTVLTLPAALWHEWVADLQRNGQSVPVDLRVIGVGTERVSAEALITWRAQGGERVRFIQGYGPTEATITCTMHHVLPGDPVLADEQLPIGRPLPNTEVHVLDAAGWPVPMGVVGELCIGGAGLARGYRGRPDVTAQRFVPHPFDPQARARGMRLYRTGDRGQRRADGALIIHGRSDFQVKIRGHRVELGDIEAAIGGLSGIQSCVVLWRTDMPGEGQLVAYVVPNAWPPHDDALVELWAAGCAERLPAHMVPQAWVQMARFPVGLQGKIDRKALPAPPSAAISAPSTSELSLAADEDDIAMAVRRAFEMALQRSDVPTDASFFDLGGTSLAAMRVVSHIERELGLTVTLTQLFGAPTVEALSASLRAPTEPGHLDVAVCLAQGSGVPVWLFGGVSQYRELASGLDGRHPVYAVLLSQEEKMLRDGCPPDGLSDLADACADLVLNHCGSVVPVLGGFSYGGALAYEVALRLHAAMGQAPALLLIDTMLPSGLGPGGFRPGLGPWLVRQWHAWRVGGWRVLAARAARLRHRWRQPAQATDREAGAYAHRGDRFAEMLQAFESTAQPYAGPTVIYRATQEDRFRCVPAGLGFAPHLKGAWQEVPVDTVHLGMLQAPAVEVLVRDLIARLQGIGSGNAPSGSEAMWPRAA